MPNSKSLSSDIIIIGNVNLDIIMGPQAPWPQAGTEVVLENSEIRAGGSAGNTSLALEALGCRHKLLCNMGDDFMGRWLRERFSSVASDWTHSDRPTTFSVGITHPDGERTFFTNQGHLDAFCLADIEQKLTPAAVKGAIVLMVGTFLSPLLMDEYVNLLPKLRKSGARIALDTGWPNAGWTSQNRAVAREWIAYCDEVLLNESEVCGLFDCAPDELPRAAVEFVQLMPDNGVLVVKQGPDGASAWQKNADVIRCPGQMVEVIDTVGAGDCFNAGYLIERASGAGLQACLQRGIEVASSAISTSPRRYR